MSVLHLKYFNAVTDAKCPACVSPTFGKSIYDDVIRRGKSIGASTLERRVISLSSVVLLVREEILHCTCTGTVQSTM